jgi:hypothetical protein
MNRLVQVQRDHNVQTDSGWNLFAEHRRQVTQLLMPGQPHGGQRLCVLGAGNCNDIDLAQLTSAYSEVHLVDLDEQALQRALERHPAAAANRICLHGGCDLSGILEPLSRWSPQAPAHDEDVSRTIAQALAAPPPLKERFSTTASVCLLSQMIHSIVLSLGEDHPRFVDLMSAVRLRHLRYLAELTAPGGHILLITDVVSSDSCRQLVDVAPEQVPALIRQLIEHRNFFHGVNPAVIAHILRSDPELAARNSALEFIPPWRWNLGPRVYAVYGMKWRCSQTSANPTQA